MASIENRASILLFAAITLFVASLLLVWDNTGRFWLSLIWTTMDTFGLFYSPVSVSTPSSVLVIFSDLFGTIAFILITFYLASWFYGFVRKIDFWGRLSTSKIKKLKDHVIVAPYNVISEFLVEDLKKEGITAVVITDKQSDMPRIRRMGAIALFGNTGLEDTFKAAGVNRAAYVVACSDDDTKNALISVTARSVNKKVKIIARAKRTDDIAKISKAGAQRIIIPESSAGERIGSEILKSLFYK
jgi:voltage-gated potassium channel